MGGQLALLSDVAVAVTATAGDIVRFDIPSLLLTNANRILNKLDELSLLLSNEPIDLVAVTETWLSDEIPDSVVSINGYLAIRRDRSTGIGGGVMCYVSNRLFGCQLNLNTKNDQDFEILWILVRPCLLPRPMSVIIVAVLYCPPWYCVEKCRNLTNYIVECVDELSKKYSNPCLLIVGDFNSLDCTTFNRYLHLKQLVIGPTRGANTLDKIFTNYNEYFSIPDIIAPLGKSDHCCVLLKPSCRQTVPVGRKNFRRRCLNSSILDQIGYALVCINWNDMYRLDDVQSQTDFFYSVVNSVIDSHAPVKECVVKMNDKPWITPKFKELVAERNAAFKVGDRIAYKRLRNQVNRLRLNLQRQFYCNHVDNLKKKEPHNWWKSIKNICGIESKDRSSLEHMTFQGNAIANHDLPETFSNFLVSIVESIPPIDNSSLNDFRNQLTECPESFIVSEYAVYHALTRLKASRSTGPDLLDNKLLINLADVFAAPVCCIINSSIRQGVVPFQWKLSRVTPIPK
jgi:hypothetical protein